MVCASKKAGGLGIKRLKLFNKALVEKMGWFLLEGEKDWAQILRAKYLKNKEGNCFIRKKELPYGSMFWNNLLKTIGILTRGAKMRIGNGLSIDFWEDT